tara:strand:+ start:4464 stop:5435 length:972 start_codon:yes stop_codon:yes gene_type:complete
MDEATSFGSFLIDLHEPDAAIALSGIGHKTLHLLEAKTGASFVLRGLQLEISGRHKDIEKAVAIVELIRPLWEEGQQVSSVDLQAAIRSIDTGRKSSYEEVTDQVLARSKRGELLRPRTERQKIYLEAIKNNDLTFAIGPAGTGKTFLATVCAVNLLNERKVEKLILTRPAVEAGERLGFLPGDLQQKVDPYLRPLYDALHSLMGEEKTANLLEKGVIEVAPLAYMRGRTLDEAFIILDEAQNTTSSQMRMVLTRLGGKSKMVVTGDITQIDLPQGQKSGLVEAAEILKGIDGVSICRLSSMDVVRHPLVQRVVDAYALFDNK